MRLYTALLVLLTSVGAHAQTAVKSVETIEDIEIGMPADLVIAGLTKQGYALKDLFQLPPASGLAEWQVSFKDKSIGTFSVEKGRISAAARLVYDSQDSAPGDGAIGLAEALYWIFFDNGRTLPSENRDWKQAGTDVQFTTREIESRTPGSSLRMIFADMKNGAHYRITLLRNPGKPSLVVVDKTAPFIKKP